MAYDECRDCETVAAKGAGFRGGRCPACFAAFVARRQEADELISAEDQAESAPRGV